MSSDLINALKLMVDEKGYDLDDLISTIEEAVAFAAMKRLERGQLHVRLDKERGEFFLYERAVVVEEPVEEDDVTLVEAREIKEDAELGDIIETPVKCIDLGRIAAGSVRQMIKKKGREADRTRLSSELSARKGQIVTGSLVRKEDDGFLFNIGDCEAFLSDSDRLSHDRYERGRPVKLAIAGVNDDKRRPLAQVSRTMPELLARLLEREIPEIGEAIIEIVAVVRDSSGRAKVAVRSHKPGVDAVGSCVGARGGRIQPIMSELSGEKIDIFEWHSDPAIYIARALAPAKKLQVTVIESKKFADVVVADDQLSLAIGKKGVNVKLAQSLTGYEMDVMNAEESEKKKERMAELNTRPDYKPDDTGRSDKKTATPGPTKQYRPSKG